MTIADDRIHRFTRAEYYQMAEAGMFGEQRVELLEGKILDMSPQNNPHSVVIMLLDSFLHKHPDSERFMIRPQLPLAVSDMNEPEPDLAVVEGDAREIRDHPSTALLVIEVADDSLARDRKKAAVYGAAGVQEYWIVNLRARQIEQHISLRGAAGNIAGTAVEYDEVRVLSAGDVIECGVLPLPGRRVDEFLPRV